MTVTAPKRQAAPRFAPAIPLSVAVVPRPKSPASAEPVALSKSTDLRLTHRAPTVPLPNPIPLKIQFPYQYHGDRDGEHQITSENEVGHGAMA